MKALKNGTLRKALHGLGLAILVAVVNSLCFPLLVDLYDMFWQIYHYGYWDGSLSNVASEIWIIFAFLGAMYMSPPSLIVGLAFFGAYQLPGLRSHREQRRILPVSVLLGSLVALVGMVLFFSSDPYRVFSEGWGFAVLVWITEVLIFVWLGKRIAKSP